MYLLFCSYGDWKDVYEETAEFLSVSPSFLELNKHKTIQVSTLKNKLAEWSTQVDNQRRDWDPISEFDDCQIHAPWILLVIQIQKSKKASKVSFSFFLRWTFCCVVSTHEQEMQQRHGARARSAVNVRNDGAIAQRVPVPPVPPSQRAAAPQELVANVDGSRIVGVQAAAAAGNFR